MGIGDGSVTAGEFCVTVGLAIPWDSWHTGFTGSNPRRLKGQRGRAPSRRTSRSVQCTNLLNILLLP